MEWALVPLVPLSGATPGLGSVIASYELYSQLHGYVLLDQVGLHSQTNPLKKN